MRQMNKGWNFTDMHKQTLTLLISLSLFTAAGYAEGISVEALQASVTEAHNQIKALQKENKKLKEKLAVKEKEIAEHRAKLEKLEADIAVLKEK